MPVFFVWLICIARSMKLSLVNGMGQMQRAQLSRWFNSKSAFKMQFLQILIYPT